MRKLGKREYKKIIIETLVNKYGNTLVEGDTDLMLASAVLRRLKPFLHFHEHDMSKKEFDIWYQKFKRRKGYY